MSRAAVEQVCFSLRDRGNRARFLDDPGAYLSEVALTDGERAALSTGDVGALFCEGVALGALELLGRAFGYDNEAYVQRLRRATGRPLDQEQLAVLRLRTEGGRVS